MPKRGSKVRWNGGEFDFFGTSALLRFRAVLKSYRWANSRDFQPDLIVPEDVRIEGETGKHVLSGYDKRAMPLLYLRPGRENTQPSDRQIRYLVWSLERAVDFMPPGQEKMCLVIDYKSATQQNNPSFSTSRKVLDILQNHYVERLGRAYVSSVPWFIVSCAKPVADMFHVPYTVTASEPFLPDDQSTAGSCHQRQDPIQQQYDRFCPRGTAGFGVGWRTLQLSIRPREVLVHFACECVTVLFSHGGLTSSSFRNQDFCGIAADGTRTHEPYSKNSTVSTGAEADADDSLLPSKSAQGDSLSKFLQHDERDAATATVSTTTTAPTTAPTSTEPTRDSSLRSDITPPEDAHASQALETKVEPATASV